MEEKNVEGTYKVVEKLLENVDSLYNFQKSKLYRHKKFKNTDGSYFQVIKMFYTSDMENVYYADDIDCYIVMSVGENDMLYFPDLSHA